MNPIIGSPILAANNTFRLDKPDEGIRREALQQRMASIQLRARWVMSLYVAGCSNDNPRGAAGTTPTLILRFQAVPSSSCTSEKSRHRKPLTTNWAGINIVVVLLE